MPKTTSLSFLENYLRTRDKSVPTVPMHYASLEDLIADVRTAKEMIGLLIQIQTIEAPETKCELTKEICQVALHRFRVGL